MEFDKSKVYTALNADEVKVGSKVILADSLAELKDYVRRDEDIETLEEILDESHSERFCDDATYRWSLAYLVSEPEEKKLKWTDLKIGDIIRKKYGDGYRFATVIRIDTYSTKKHIGLGGEWPSDEELEEWEKVEE